MPLNMIQIMCDKKQMIAYKWFETTAIFVISLCIVHWVFICGGVVRSAVGFSW